MLPGTGDEEERLHLAVGAALALKTLGHRGIVVAYARKGEMAPSAWRRVLAPAQNLDLPIVFVVLARTGPRKKGAELTEVCKFARRVGVPAIPVDSCDAVALYRVTQESFGRTRSGDGPVLIESVSWRIKGTRDSVDDPLDHLKESLLARRICTDAWFGQLAKTTRGLLMRPSAASNKA
jgi:TPP-dependent pyruvate/acetoin dehydrogenase alpha subunit